MMKQGGRWSAANKKKGLWRLEHESQQLEGTRVVLNSDLEQITKNSRNYHLNAGKHTVANTTKAWGKLACAGGHSSPPKDGGGGV